MNKVNRKSTRDSKDKYKFDDWRIIIGNINSFPNESDGKNKYKMDIFKQLVTKKHTDIIMISEHNKNFSRTRNGTKSTDSMKKWWPNTIVRTSCLLSDYKSTFEPGGTMIVTNTRSTAHTCEAGSDKEGLGRWNYITIKGKKDYYTTLISIYRPNKYQETYMRQTAYTAKRRKIVSSETTPEQIWYHDLKDLIQEKINKGHEVIVAGDFNDDLNNQASITSTFMSNLGMTELMLSQYGPGPATHARGSKTIDGIFATKKIAITRGCYISLEQSPSDHRWLEIKISEECLLGIPRDDLCPPMVRKTTSKIPSVKARFQMLLDQQVSQYGLHNKIEALYEHIVEGRPFRQEQEETYEIVEERMQRAVKFADNMCRKIRRGPIPFLPSQKKFMGHILILKQLKLRYLQKGKPNRPRCQRIKRLIKKYDYKGHTKFTCIEEIDKAINKAVAQYDLFKPRASEARWLYLEQLASELHEQDGKGRQHHYKILFQREMIKESFKSIRYCEGKRRGGGVDHVQIEVAGGHQIIYDKDAIEKEIMRVNEKKLLQAKDTPMRQSVLSDLLGEQGNFKRWEEILQGSIPLPEGIDEGLRIWYEYISKAQSHTPFDLTWTTDEYVESWKRMKEDKMTLPGIQVAHIKCLSKDSIGASVLSKLALIPLMVGYSPKTWRIGIDSMIPKKTADLRPEKLRLILLMDARFNHNNKRIEKKMMEYGETHSLLAPEQFGSRKSKSAIEHATNKRLVMDNIRQTGTNAIYLANDAKSCYDRILLIVAYLTMRKFGVPALVAQSSIATLLSMRHHVRTRYGDSDNYYGGEKWTIKPHGCGQGNGYGPALWACISSPLLHLLRKHGHGTKITTPLSKLLIHISAFAFVDDVDLIQTARNHKDEVTGDTPYDINGLVNDTQESLNKWASMLQATGGALEPTKTFYVPIIPQWQGNHKEVKPIAWDNELILKGPDGRATTLQQNDPNDTFFTLGIWQSPSGNEEKQQDYLIKKIKEWGINTNKHNMSWRHASIAVQSTLGRTLVYPLTATAFSDRQCAQIQKVLLTEVLGKMGFVRTMPEIIATSPVCLGGLGILSFEVQQLLGHVSLLLQHGPNENTITHKLLRSSLESYALETGLSGDPLQMPWVPYATPDTWVSQTLKSMHKFNISISSGIQGLQKWSTNDIFIMEKMGYFYSGQALATINKVRLYLRVVTLSDIISADGTSYDVWEF